MFTKYAQVEFDIKGVKGLVVKVSYSVTAKTEEIEIVAIKVDLEDDKANLLKKQEMVEMLLLDAIKKIEEEKSLEQKIEEMEWDLS